MNLFVQCGCPCTISVDVLVITGYVSLTSVQVFGHGSSALPSQGLCTAQEAIYLWQSKWRCGVVVLTQHHEWDLSDVCGQVVQT